MIVQFPSVNSRIHKWSKQYYSLYASQGWLVAGQWLAENVPEQFYKQIQEELKRLMSEQ